MGTQPNPQGVTLKFLDKDGKELRSVSGKFAKFFSRPRPLNPGVFDAVLGSADWLTDVLVADTAAKLANMQPTQDQAAATSQSSRQVLVRWDVGNDTGGLQDCLTLCSGAMIAPKVLSANEVRVLPPETVMDSNHPLFKDWEDGAVFLRPAMVALKPSA